jgi:hypothetical protein
MIAGSYFSPENICFAVQPTITIIHKSQGLVVIPKLEKALFNSKKYALTPIPGFSYIVRFNYDI